MEFEGPVNLDKDGKSIVTVRTDGNVNFTATVTDVKGNFEYVNYEENSVTITGSLLPTASNDSITTNEDTPYTLTKDDFGNIGNTTNTQNVAKIKFDSLPANGTIYVLKTEYTASMNDRAEYTISKSNDKVYIKLETGDIVDISQIEKGNVIFVPNKNSDTNGEFKFKVSSGGISDSSFKNVVYTTTIDVKAVADAPNVEMNIVHEQKIGKIITYTFKNNGESLNASANNGNNGNSKNSYTVQLIEEVENVTINLFTGQGSIPQVSGVVIFFDKDGKEVGTRHNFENTLKLENISPSNNATFSSFKIVNSEEGCEFKFTGYSYESNKDNLYDNKYFIDLSAKLTDTDGSESLAKDENGNKIVTIKNIPEGSTLYGTDGKVIEAKDGIYTVKVDSNGDAKVTLTNSEELSDAYLDGIQASVISTDTPKDGSEAVSNAISFAGGGDIDLSNLKNIVNLKEINLDNGKENKLNLTLDDVLKLSGDDNTIKISGDSKDSVSFKNTTGENGQAQTWSKAENSIVEDGKTFEVYTNSGDESLKVKVEQPIEVL